MDPQHRLVLEVAWEAIEHAGIAPPSLAGSRTGVFVGITTDDYLQRMVAIGEPRLLDAYSHHGNVLNAAAGRLSYVLGVHGPSMAIDTACSSSLVALHVACESLRSADCDLALAGGVNLILSPMSSVRLSRARMLAPDGRCKTFDAAADGYGRGEGCGVVVLKRLSAAVAAGDRVLAVVRGSAINQDGRTSALTVPNGLAQRAVVRDALEHAGILAADVSYVEAHGTGTALGDPIEIEALADVFGGDRRAPLLVGSLKTNLGHLESAAGIVGAIKVALALQHGEIPPHLNFRTPSPHIPWSAIPIAVPTALAPWPEGRRIACVSAFGASGTNAHVVLEAAPETGREVATPPERTGHVLVLSAETEAGLRTVAGRYVDALDHAEGNIGDICHTAAAGRGHYAWRAAVAGRSLSNLRDGVTALAEARTSAAIQRGRVDRGTALKIAFLFTGQGAQYPGMGRDLYESQPVFREALEACGLALAPHLDVPLLSLLYPEAGADATRLDRTAYTQPALFALEYALARMLMSWGIQPAAVLGHSVGEFAAACVAGVASLDDTAKLIALRGRLMQALPAGGAMVALTADERSMAARLRSFDDRVAIAAINAPDQLVLSGDRVALDALLDEAGVPQPDRRYLPVSHAFHSPLIAPMLDSFEGLAAGITQRAPAIPFISNLVGAALEAAPGARYWRDHAARPVRFADGVKTLVGLGCTVLVEVGPTPTLLALAMRSIDPDHVTAVPTLRRGRSDWDQLSRALGSLYVTGAPIDWQAVDRGLSRRRVALPTYPFARERHWIDQTVAGPANRPPAVGDAEPRPMVGVRIESPRMSGIAFQAEVGGGSPAFLDDHRVLGRIVYPAAAFIELALEAALESAPGGPVVRLDDLDVIEALPVGAGSRRHLQTIVSANDAGRENRDVQRACGGIDGWLALDIARPREDWRGDGTRRCGPGRATRAVRGHGRRRRLLRAAAWSEPRVRACVPTRARAAPRFLRGARPARGAGHHLAIRPAAFHPSLAHRRGHPDAGRRGPRRRRGPGPSARAVRGDHGPARRRAMRLGTCAGARRRWQHARR